MKLILQKDVKSLGKAGDKVQVKDGYARNYLIPKKLALNLNEGRLKEQKHKENIIKARKKQAVSDRKLLLEQISKVSLVFEKESYNDGRLFGSVNSVEISKALEKEHKISVDKKDIISEPIKTVGEHALSIKLDSENQADLKVVVNKKETKKSNQFVEEEEDPRDDLSTTVQTKDDSPEQDKDSQTESDTASSNNNQQQLKTDSESNT